MQGYFLDNRAKNQYGSHCQAEACTAASLFVDKQFIATLYDRELLEEKKFAKPLPLKKDSQIDILVENMGRVNFGPYMELQRKGIDHCVQINGHIHNNWQQYIFVTDYIIVISA